MRLPVINHFGPAVFYVVIAQWIPNHVSYINFILGNLMLILFCYFVHKPVLLIRLDLVGLS